MNKYQKLKTLYHSRAHVIDLSKYVGQEIVIYLRWLRDVPVIVTQASVDMFELTIIGDHSDRASLLYSKKRSGGFNFRCKSWVIRSHGYPFYKVI